MYTDPLLANFIYPNGNLITVWIIKNFNAQPKTVHNYETI